MTPQNVQEAIDTLESVDPNDEYAYEKAFLGFKIIKKLPIFIITINHSIEVFRARTSFDPVFFEKIGDVALPPRELIKDFARCNRPFQPKFYCAENRPTSYMELVDYWIKNREVNEVLYVTTGKWIVHKPFTALIVTSPYPDQRTSEFDIHHGHGFDQILNRYDGKEKEAYIMLYDYLFTKFRKSAKNDPHTYLVTSTYCNSALSSSQNIDAIYYPSVPFKGAGVNFAFSASFIQQENIELLDALRDEFTVYANEIGKKSFKQIGSISASNISQTTGLISW